MVLFWNTDGCDQECHFLVIDFFFFFTQNPILSLSSPSPHCTLFYFILFLPTLVYYIILYYIILHYTILYCIIVWYTIPILSHIIIIIIHQNTSSSYIKIHQNTSSSYIIIHHHCVEYGLVLHRSTEYI